MAGPDRDDQRLGVEMLEAQSHHAVGLGETADHRIDLALLQLRQQTAIGTGEHTHRRQQALAARGPQHPGHEGGRHRGQRSQRQVDLALLGRHALHRRVERAHHRAGMAQEDLRLRSEPRALATTLEKTHFENVFQLGQGLGHGGLAHVQCLGSSPQVAQAGHGQEAVQVPQLNAMEAGKWHINNR